MYTKMPSNILNSGLDILNSLMDQNLIEYFRVTSFSQIYGNLKSVHLLEEGVLI